MVYSSLFDYICFFLNYISVKTSFFEFDSGFLGKALFYYFEMQFKDTFYDIYTVIFLSLLTIFIFVMTFGIDLKAIIRFLILARKIISTFFTTILKPNIFKKFWVGKKMQDLGERQSKVKQSFAYNKSKAFKNNKFILPSIKFLEEPKKLDGLESENRKNAEVNRALLTNVLSDFKITGEIVDVKQGPIVTLFELKPAPGTLTSSVISRTEDIARSMSMISARISTIPGKDALKN